MADWQIANLDNLSDYMRNYRNNIADRRGWHHGALYVGMMNWAALPGNEKYFTPLRKIAEEEEWKLGDRLFHGDDHIVGQLYLTFYEREQDKDMIDHTIRQFNQILVSNPDDTLEFLGDSVQGVGRVCQLRWCWCDALFMAPQTWMRLSLAALPLMGSIVSAATSGSPGVASGAGAAKIKYDFKRYRETATMVPIHKVTPDDGYYLQI